MKKVIMENETYVAWMWKHIRFYVSVIIPEYEIANWNEHRIDLTYGKKGCDQGG